MYSPASPMSKASTSKPGIHDMKLNRLRQHCQRLRDDLDRPMISVSEASMSLIKHAETTRDPLVPSVWGTVRPSEDPFATPKGAGSEGGCCCIA